MRVTVWWLVVVAGVSGCAASVKELRHHPQQERLERLLAEILPHTTHAEKHYWVRVTESTKRRIGLAVLPHRHIYVATELLEEADDDLVRALLAHGVAHHRLHHHTRRGGVRILSQLAFKAGGFFVPGLSYGHYAGDPIVEAAFSVGHEEGADKQAAVYLARMGRSPQDLIRAYGFLQEHGYAERVGRLVIPPHRLALRTSALQDLGPSQ